MTETSYPRHQARPEGDLSTARAQVSRLAYRYEQYRRPAEAIAAMRAQLLEGWRIVQIRGPADGPFEVAYLRALSRERGVLIVDHEQPIVGVLEGTIRLPACHLQGRQLVHSAWTAMPPIRPEASRNGSFERCPHLGGKSSY